MFTRVRLASVAFFLLLASVTTSFAQQSDTTAASRSGARPGRGAVGAQVGTSSIVTGEDYSRGAQPRMTFEGSYRYVISRGWRWQVSPYFTWNAYRTGTQLPFTDLRFPDNNTADFVLTQIAGANGQVQRTWGKGNWISHVGAGPAVYRVVLQNHRKVIKDPVSLELHKGTYIGATAEFGIERFMRSLPSTSLEWTVAYQTAFAWSDNRFPSGYNAAPGAIEIRFGGHYYFDFKTPKKSGGTPARAS
jgi:hypothetical protein